MDAKKPFELFKRITYFVLLSIFLAGVTACDEKDEPTPPAPQPAKYTIKGQVLNQQTNAPLSGVLVTMGVLTQTTNATGSFEFKDLTAAGKYTLLLTKENFFSSTYSIEFQAAAPNHTITYTLSATMVPFVPGVTPINPASGGTIAITGTVPAALSIPANTTIKDKDNNVITGSVNITAVSIPNIIAGDVVNPGIAVLQFGPTGLQFSNPLPLLVDNPLLNYRFTTVQLEYFNTTLSKWEVKPQAVTYTQSSNKYGTTINHFSSYKLSFTAVRSYLGAIEENVDVTDYIIENRTLSPMNVTKIAIKRKNGYFFPTPLTTLLSSKGVTGADATKLVSIIEEFVKPYYGNTAALSALAVVNDNVSVSRVIQPDYKLVTTGRQAIDRNTFTFSITKPDGTTTTIEVLVHSAGAVTLFHEDKYYTHGPHGSGGGGSN